MLLGQRRTGGKIILTHLFKLLSLWRNYLLILNSFKNGIWITCSIFIIPRCCCRREWHTINTWVSLLITLLTMIDKVVVDGEVDHDWRQWSWPGWPWMVMDIWIHGYMEMTTCSSPVKHQNSRSMSWFPNKQSFSSEPSWQSCLQIIKKKKHWWLKLIDWLKNSWTNKKS